MPNSALVSLSIISIILTTSFIGSSAVSAQPRPEPPPDLSHVTGVLQFNATYYNVSSIGLPQNETSNNLGLKLYFDFYNPQVNQTEVNNKITSYNVTITRSALNDGSNVTVLNDGFFVTNGFLAMDIRQPTQNEAALIKNYQPQNPVVNTPSGYAVVDQGGAIIYGLDTANPLSYALWRVPNGTDTVAIKSAELLQPGIYRAHVEIAGLGSFTSIIKPELRPNFGESWSYPNASKVPEFRDTGIILLAVSVVAATAVSRGYSKRIVDKHRAA